jgi:peptidoglycan/xylan/chitin deacetylase (PgdA/CDA1 family)
MGLYSNAIRLAGRTGLDSALGALEHRALGPNHIRAVAYHGVSDVHAKAFARQLDYYCQRYESVDEAGLSRFLAGQERTRPGLVISFDDGLADNYRNAAPLLEERGLCGWFFVVTGLLDCSLARHEDYCREHSIISPPGSKGRIGMIWDEVRDLAARGHVIGCHGAGHIRYRSNVCDEDIAEDLATATLRIRQELSMDPYSFAWVGGETDTYKPSSAALIQESGFGFAFTTLSQAILPGSQCLPLHRTVLDADMEPGAMKVKLHGVSDVVHGPSRYRASFLGKQKL